MRINLRMGWLVSYMSHRRITAFWLVAMVSLTTPWSLKGCQITPAKTSKVYDDCAVLSIYDGDTMTANCAGEKVKVRLYCIDAPEMGQKPWGTMSRDHLRGVTGETVRLVAHDRDRYGRIVGEVYSGDTNLNLLQVQSGNAVEYDKYCHENIFRHAENVAHSNHIGIWTIPGEHQRPWAWRELH